MTKAERRELDDAIAMTALNRTREIIEKMPNASLEELMIIAYATGGIDAAEFIRLSLVGRNNAAR